MSLYTTPLQIGYFFALLMWMLFLIRGYREDRLSDKLLGWIMFILAMELQDYTFGFAGINVLWNELNGFPRGVSLLFGPVVYLYFLAQTNRSFKLSRKHIWHFVPYLLYVVYELSAFVQGPVAVQNRQESDYNLVMGYVLRFAIWASYIYYLYKCLVIYRKYRSWSIHQFSNTELINFNWFRDFLYAMIFWLLCREVMNILDAFLNLDFYQDWWWNLALVAVVFYIGLAGISQRQPARIQFEMDSGEPPGLQGTDSALPQAPDIDSDKTAIAEKLKALMERDRLFLQPDLNLNELAQHLQVSAPQVSAAINQVFQQNFNDYVNSLRIEEFIRLYEKNSEKYTLLSLAYDSGFNSKATFNRAFKKIKGSAPRTFLSR
ncbi:helix-turn-helix domain-containing protein [Robiginitalea aurantiaca]|uniref:Helix-turn-helix domain-containing protein n=1 Tax=Robiginitalea aurantiaca TaxID=3056915 RepID=A0ABT7WIQ5_9FLAO|nr:helix-turn-helix domain-containing protein [Robiginitalea aurantiaca]MDM9632781.1 helix-turn-helix domain-containing protein [Robiginitalea aurantiaca]